MPTTRHGRPQTTVARGLVRLGLTIVPVEWIFGGVALGTGAALLVTILTSISLAIGVAVSLLLSVAAVILVRARLPKIRRQALAVRLETGLRAGVLATVAYDGVRLLVLLVAPHVLWPFDVFGLFGRLLAPGMPSAVQSTIGIAFHAANGIGFAVAFVLVFARPSIWAGLAWAFGLELLMVSIYPGWLGLHALDEFVTVSVAGHAAYGLVLGGVASSAVVNAQPDAAGADVP